MVFRLLALWCLLTFTSGIFGNPKDPQSAPVNSKEQPPEKINQTSKANDAQLNKLAGELVKLRGEVETLHSELEEKKTNYKNERNALGMRVAEVDARIQEDSIRIKEMQDQLTKKKEILGGNKDSFKSLKPGLLRLIAGVLEDVEKNLPFKRQQRQGYLNKLSHQIENSEITVATGLNRLWVFLEDELRLANTQGLYRDTIVIDGEEQLAEIAKVGMMTMFYKTLDGESYGYVKNTNTGWTFKKANDRNDVKTIALVFEHFKKQVRTGPFALPLDLYPTFILPL